MRRSVALVLAVLVITPLVAALEPPNASGGPSRVTPGYHEHITPVAKTDETVSFNTNSLKYHCPTCSAARRCTRNCIDIKKSDAIRRGGVACKICTGTCG